MSKTFSAPGAQVPSVPSASLETPDTWFAATLPAVLMAVVGSVTDPAFRPNVVVSTDRLTGSPSLEEIAGGVRQRVAAFDDSHPAMDQDVTVDQRRAHLIQFTYRHPVAGTLGQSILTVPVEHDGVVDLFEVVGTFGADRIKEDAEVVNRVLQSFSAR